MFSLYIIQNTVTKEIYIGKTSNLKRRLAQHNSNDTKSTRGRNGKWILIYAEAYRNKKDVDARENALKKHGSGKRWLKDRIKNSMLEN
jgi:putative endonuclease